MKWKDHKRLIKAATNEHHVPLSTYKGLLDGVIYPDKINIWLKNQGRPMERHHYHNTAKIMKLIWRSRREWLKNNETDAGFLLGQALHYIHDSYVSKGFLGLFHESNENKINSLTIKNDSLCSGINDSKCDPVYIEKIIESIKSQNPEDALNGATYVTASLIKAVFNREAASVELKGEFNLARIEHKKYLKTGIVAGIITLLLGAISHLSSFQSIQVILFALVLGFVIVKMDRKYYKIEKQVNWFIIE